MHQPSCPIEIAEQGSWYSTMKPYCSCPKFNDDITVNNFLQVGETIECGSCHPDKFEHCTTIQGKYGVKCKCVCHGKPTTEHTHHFVFSHQAQKAIGAQAIYQTVNWVICNECGFLKSQIL